MDWTTRPAGSKDKTAPLFSSLGRNSSWRMRPPLSRHPNSPEDSWKACSRVQQHSSRRLALQTLSVRDAPRQCRPRDLELESSFRDHVNKVTETVIINFLWWTSIATNPSVLCQLIAVRCARGREYTGAHTTTQRYRGWARRRPANNDNSVVRVTHRVFVESDEQHRHPSEWM